MATGGQGAVPAQDCPGAGCAVLAAAARAGVRRVGRGRRVGIGSVSRRVGGVHGDLVAQGEDLDVLSRSPRGRRHSSARTS